MTLQPPVPGWFTSSLAVARSPSASLFFVLMASYLQPRLPHFCLATTSKPWKNHSDPEGNPFHFFLLSGHHATEWVFLQYLRAQIVPFSVSRSFYTQTWKALFWTECLRMPFNTNEIATLYWVFSCLVPCQTSFVTYFWALNLVDWFWALSNLCCKDGGVAIRNHWNCSGKYIIWRNVQIWPGMFCPWREKMWYLLVVYHKPLDSNQCGKTKQVNKNRRSSKHFFGHDWLFVQRPLKFC